MSITMVEMLQKEIQSLCTFFSFLKIVKIKPTNKVQRFFSKRDAFNARKTILFISFNSLIGMEWTKAFLVGMDLCNMAQFYFLLKMSLKKFFVVPALPSNNKNSFDHHNSYNKGPNLACNGLLESPLNFPSTKKVSKHPITNYNYSFVPKILKFHIWNSKSFRDSLIFVLYLP